MVCDSKPSPQPNPKTNSDGLLQQTSTPFHLCSLSPKCVSVTHSVLARCTLFNFLLRSSSSGRRSRYFSLSSPKLATLQRPLISASPLIRNSETPVHLQTSFQVFFPFDDSTCLDYHLFDFSFDISSLGIFEIYMM